MCLDMFKCIYLGEKRYYLGKLIHIFFKAYRLYNLHFDYKLSRTSLCCYQNSNLYHIRLHMYL
jgi:hypothetical protein